MPDTEPTIKATNFLLGTYTNENSKGIYRYALQTDGSLDSVGLVVESIQPSFLAYTKDRDYVLAVNEVNDQDGKGTVESFAVKGDSLTQINKQSSGGAHPCHINVDARGYVLTSNYSGGNIGMHQLATDGQLSELLFVEEHNKEKDAKAHAHSAWFYGDEDAVVSVDLGTNELWFSEIDKATNTLKAQDPARLFIKEGAGPRHLTFHPNGQWAYVINELNSTVSLISVADPENNREWEQIAAYSTLPEGYSEDSFCADIHISQDGKFVYASNRGHNSLAIFGVNPNDGTLALLGHESIRGDWPRNFALSPDDAFVIVANQRSNNLVAFKRDTETGLLTFTSEINAPTPTCILF
jgi:6-phosphogluconolactonase